MIELIYAFQCSDCHETAYQRHKHLMGTEAPQPQLPKGWSQAEEKLICHRHVVKAGAGKSLVGLTIPDRSFLGC
jgi:hypothetical protein